VEVVVGGGVFDGTDVWVGAFVAKACVTDGVTAAKVGVSVPGAFDGKLQADMAGIRLITNNKFRNFIALSFCWLSIILCRNLEDGNSSSDSNKKSLM
jgi:shikimate kinase